MHHSLWADTVADEERIWSAFLDILSGIDNPVLIHYGSFETTFLKRMCDRYGGPREDSVAAKAITSSVNLLSVIFAQVYFPSYSNGLKEIARFLGFEWTDPSSSGLQSIVWRHRWEESRDPTIREKLIAYNADDCEALRLVAHTLGRLSEPDIDPDESPGSEPGIVHAESLGKNVTSKWCAIQEPAIGPRTNQRSCPLELPAGSCFRPVGDCTRKRRQSEPGHAGPSRKQRRWSCSRLRPPARNAANDDGEKVDYFPEPCRIWSSAGTA